MLYFGVGVVLTQRPKPKPTPQVPIEELVESTKHVISLVQSRYCCAACRQSFHRTDSSLRPWLSTGCTPSTELGGRPTLIPLPIHKGNSTSHSTHRLKSFNNIIYCAKCGARDSWRGFVSLSRPCVPPRRYGAASLAALRSGLPPPGRDPWHMQKEIDRPFLKRTAKSFVGVRLPINRKHNVTKVAPSILPLPDDPTESAATPCPLLFPAVPELPPQLQVPAEMLELAQDGEKVVWPPGLSAFQVQGMLNQHFYPSSSSCAPVTHQPIPLPAPTEEASSSTAGVRPQINLDLLADLVDLHDAGEPVSWPCGVSPTEAKDLLRSTPSMDD